MSLTPASTADTLMNAASQCVAIIRASVVLPVPGGPQNTIECRRFRSSAWRSVESGPSRCVWPASSDSSRGRIRSASGPGGASGAAARSGGAGSSASNSPSVPLTGS